MENEPRVKAATVDRNVINKRKLLSTYAVLVIGMFFCAIKSIAERRITTEAFGIMFLILGSNLSVDGVMKKDTISVSSGILLVIVAFMFLASIIK